MKIISAKSVTKKLQIVSLIAITFLTVSGGPYGLESLLNDVGFTGSILLLIIVPLFWDVPTLYFVLQLNAIMPVNGGYYQWVKKFLGLRWAWYEGWWTWLYTFVDLAIYPVLFTEYASYFFPVIATYKFVVCLLIIWIGVLINILGIAMVGESSILLSAIVILSFVLLFVMYAVHHPSNFIQLSNFKLNTVNTPSMGLALFTVMWNFIGWDNTTTYAQEVEKPVKTYTISTITTFILILIVYFLTIVTAHQSGIDTKLLSDKGFPALGFLVGGHWLGSLIAFGGMASSIGLFSAVLLSVSRIPSVMANDGLLPKSFAAAHKKYQTPYLSIIVCGVVVSFLILWSFGDLIVIDITLYGAAVLLEFISLVVYHKNQINQNNRNKEIGKMIWLCVLMIFPLSVYFFGLYFNLKIGNNIYIPALIGIGALLSAEILWRIIVWNNPKIKNPSV